MNPTQPTQDTEPPPVPRSKNKGPFRIVISEKDAEKVLCALVTPAIYTCAGGLATAEGKVVTGTGAAIEGLYAAGEVTSCPCPRAWSASGVPLLFAIYTGRKAAVACAAALGAKEKVMELAAVASAEEKAPAKPEKKPEDMTREELLEYCKEWFGGWGGSGLAWGRLGVVKELESRPAAAAPVDAGPSGPTLEEVAKHNKKEPRNPRWRRGAPKLLRLIWAEDFTQ
eukprot:Skav209074  [mRNA]  locus=scaffold207:41430:48384:- [translate_table: standard]